MWNNSAHTISCIQMSTLCSFCRSQMGQRGRAMDGKETWNSDLEVGSIWWGTEIQKILPRSIKTFSLVNLTQQYDCHYFKSLVAIKSIWERIQESDNHPWRWFDVTGPIFSESWASGIPSGMLCESLYSFVVLHCLQQTTRMRHAACDVPWKKGWFQKAQSKSSLRMNENGLEKNQSFF